MGKCWVLQFNGKSKQQNICNDLVNCDDNNKVLIFFEKNTTDFYVLLFCPINQVYRWYPLFKVCVPMLAVV